MTRNISIAFSAHKGRKENIGDILSALALAQLYKIDNPILHNLRYSPNIKTKFTIYGGGGMIRPEFADREVAKSLSTDISYAIDGVGLNTDVHSLKMNDDDKKSIKKWFECAQFASVREFDTAEFLRNNFMLEVNVLPCPAYRILSSLQKPLNQTKFKIGIVPSFGHTKNYLNYLNDIVGLIRSFEKSIHKNEICLICHDSQDASFAIKHFDMKVIQPISFEDVKCAYDQVDNIITARAHGLIFSAARGRPCSYLGLADKLAFLYRYHYDTNHNEQPLDFDAKSHLMRLEKASLPKNIAFTKHTLDLEGIFD